MDTQTTPRARLTPAQVRVAAGYARGLATREIADALGMSPRAVLGHVAKAGRRLQVDGHRQEAIVDHAYRHGDFDDLPDLAVRAAATPQSLRVPRCLRRTLACIARGLSTGATANELHVTRSTVREYKRRLQQTLGTEKQPRMVALGWQFRLLGPSTRPAINPE